MTNSGKFEDIIYSNQVVSIISKKQFNWLTALSIYRTFSKSLSKLPNYTCSWFAVESQKCKHKTWAKGIQHLE